MRISNLSGSEQGSSLIEALVALFLVGMITQGSVAMSARAAASQGQLRAQEVVIGQMKSMLVSNRSNSIDICSSVPSVVIPNIPTNVTPTPQGCGNTATFQINDIPVVVSAPVVLSVDHDSIGGQIVVGGTWVSPN